MANKTSNHLKYLVATGVINFSTHTFIIILMQSGFIFDEDAHALYAEVVADELATGFGYVQFTKVLAGVTITEDDVNDRANVAWSAASWTAGGGSIGPTGGAIVLDSTAANDPVVGYIDFENDYTQVDGGVMTLSGIEFRIKAT